MQRVGCGVCVCGVWSVCGVCVMVIIFPSRLKQIDIEFMKQLHEKVSSSSVALTTITSVLEHDL